MIKIGNIVRFNKKAKHLAAKWCYKHNINGRVIDVELNDIKLDVGLCYNIYARPWQIIFVADDGDISKISEKLKATAPILSDV